MKLKRIVSAVLAGVLAVTTMVSTASADYYSSNNNYITIYSGENISTKLEITSPLETRSDTKVYQFDVSESGNLKIDLFSEMGCLEMEVSSVDSSNNITGLEIQETNISMEEGRVYIQTSSRISMKEGSVSIDNTTKESVLYFYWNSENRSMSSTAELQVEKGKYLVSFTRIDNDKGLPGSIWGYTAEQREELYGNGTLNFTATYPSADTTSKPSAPTTVKASTVSPTSTKLTWKSTADSFNIYRATSKSGTYKKIGTSESAGYTDKGLTKGKTYYYKVTAVSGGKESEFSKIVSAKACAPAPKSVKAAKSADGKAKLTWKKASGAEGYEIFMAESSGGKFSKIKTVIKGSTVSLKKSGLTSGKTYYFKIRSYITVNGKKVYSGYSKTVKVKV